MADSAFSSQSPGKKETGDLATSGGREPQPGPSWHLGSWPPFGPAAFCRAPRSVMAPSHQGRRPPPPPLHGVWVGLGLPGPHLLPSGHLRTASTLARRPHLYDRGPVVDARQTDSAWGKLREQIAGWDWGGLGSSEPTDNPKDVPMAALLNTRPLERPTVLSRVNR